MSDSSTAEPTSGARFDCPSAQPDMEGARPFGVISGTPQETRIAFFKKSALDGFNWRERFASQDATRLFRFGAKCDEHKCGHFDGSRCSLGARVKQGLPPVVDALPTCLIRPKCRWYAEQGGEVCLRCPQVVTMIPAADTPLNAVAAPR
jgi:hypothetical protein